MANIVSVKQLDDSEAQILFDNGTRANVREFIQMDSNGNMINGPAAGAISIADGADATLGAKADAASTATDVTPATGMSIWKQISKSVQVVASWLVSPALTGNAITHILAVVGQLYNGTNYDSLKDYGHFGASNVGNASGVQAVGLVAQNSNSGNAVQLIVPNSGSAVGAGQVLGVVPVNWDPVNSNNVPEQTNSQGTLLASAARTATTSSADQSLFRGMGVKVYLNVTAASGAGGLTLTIQGKDPVSGTYVNLNANPTAVTGTGLTVYEIYPGIGAASGGVTQRTSGAVSRTWRATVTAGDTSSYTYSVGFSAVR